VSVDTKMISPHNEWYIGNALVCAHFSSKLACGTYWLCSITQLIRRLGIVLIFSMLMPKPCSGDFKEGVKLSKTKELLQASKPEVSRIPSNCSKANNKRIDVLK